MKLTVVGLAALLSLGCFRSAAGPRPQTGSLSLVAPPEAKAVEVRRDVWTLVPGLSTGVFSQPGDNLEIAVSAEIYQPGGTVFFRALVDGQPVQPSDVAFKSGTVNFDGVRSFTFVHSNAAGGQHLVEIQWMAGTTASIADRTLVVYSESANSGRNRLAVVAAPSGPDVVKSTSNWESIPGLVTSITSTSGSTLAIVFSAEGGADSGRMIVRALVDGAPVGDVVFSEAGNGGRGGARSYTFSHSGGPGSHRVTMQWRADGGVSRIGDRTLAVSAVDAGSQEALTFAPSNATTFNQTGWVDLPADFSSTFVATDPVTNVAVSFSGEVKSNEGRLFLRALIDDGATAPGDVALIEGGDRWRATSHNFVLKNVPRGLHRVKVQARVDPGNPCADSKPYRTAVVQAPFGIGLRPVLSRDGSLSPNPADVGDLLRSAAPGAGSSRRGPGAGDLRAAAG